MVTLEPHGKLKIGQNLNVKRNTLPIEAGEIISFFDFPNCKFWVGIKTKTSSFWTEPSNIE